MKSSCRVVHSTRAFAACVTLLLVHSIGCKPEPTPHPVGGGDEKATVVKPLADQEVADEQSRKLPTKSPDEAASPDEKKTTGPAGAAKNETRGEMSKPAAKAGASEKAEPSEKKPTPKPSAAAKPPGGREPAKPADSAATPAEIATPAELHQPSVVFSSEHAKTCKKLVGDAMPDLKLVDLDAKDQSLGGLRGNKLTVVVFWSMKEALGREQFYKLESETFARFRGNGVNVIAVNVGDDPAKVRQAYQTAKATFPCLVDQASAAFTEIATGVLPRTYLLATDGRILWMDLVYSRTTRRELANAIHYYLLEAKK